LKPYGAEDASGTYVNRNHFAGFLGLTLPFALGFALTQPRRNAPRGIAGDSLLPRRAFWLFVTSVFFLSVVLSKSRMGIVACSGGTLAVAALRAGLGENRKPVVKTIAALMVIAFALSAWVGAGPALDRFGALDREFAQQGRGRWEIWKDTSRLIAERPWLGSGLGTFGVAYTAVQTTFLDRFVHHAHNDYLQVAAELGIPGAVLLFGTLGGVAWRTARILQQPVKESDPAVALGVVGALTAFLLHSLTDFNLYIPANALTLSCVLALGCACSHRQCERSV
jgi:O-antigen ligase